MFQATPNVASLDAIGGYILVYLLGIIGYNVRESLSISDQEAVQGTEIAFLIVKGDVTYDYRRR